MALPAGQYRTLRDLLRGMLSVEGIGPTDGDVLSFYQQLLLDSSGAPALSATRNFLCGEVLRGILSGNGSNPSDADVVSFWTQLASDSSSATPMGTTTTYRRMRNALRGAISRDALNPSDADVLSYFSSYGFQLVPLSIFATGGVWDLSALTGNQGDSIATPVASVVGVNMLTPSTPQPKLQLNAVGGKNAALIIQDPDSSASFQYFSANACAPIVRSGTFTIITHHRQDKSVSRAIWSLLRSDGSAAEQLFGRQDGEAYNLQKKTVAGGTTTRSASASADPYSDTMVAWVVSPSAVKIHVRASGKTTTTVYSLAATDATALTSGVDRLSFGAALSSVPIETFSGYLGHIRIADTALSDANVNGVFDELTRANYLKAQAVSPNVIIPGDSITVCAQDDITGAGWRDVLSRFWYDNALSFYTTGGTEAGGFGRQGLVGNTFTSSLSGQSIAQIQTQAILDINNAAGPVRFYPCMMGDGDNNSHIATATILASYKASAIAILNAGRARDPLFRMAVSTMLPLDRTQAPTEDTGVTDFNAGIAAIWDQLDALYPSNKLFRWNAHLAVGGVWVSECFADSGHLSRFGSIQAATHPTYGMLAASDGTQKLSQWMRAQSPSAARPAALVGAVTSPAPGATLTVGTPYTLTANCSRIGCTAVFKRGATVLGTGTPTEIYTNTVGSGSYAHNPNPQHRFVYTPVSGDIGAQSFSVVFTDLDGVTSTTSAAVNVTVSSGAAANPTNLVTSGPSLLWWHRADLGATIVSGEATALADQGSGGRNIVRAGGAGTGPSVVSSDATFPLVAGGNGQTLDFSSGKILFMSGQALTAPYCLYVVAKPVTWINGDVIVRDLSQSFCMQIADAFGSPNVSLVNTSFIGSVASTLGSWQLYRAHFTNSTADSLKIASGAATTGANAGNKIAAQPAIGGVSQTKSFLFREWFAYSGVPTPTEETAISAYIAGQCASVLT